MTTRQSNSGDPDTQMRALVDGRQSSVALKQVNPVLDALVEELIHRLVHNHYTFSDAQLRGIVGEVAGLRKLRERLNNRINAANAVTQEIDHG